MVIWPTKTSQKFMKRIIKYCIMTPKCGLLLKPEGIWNGQKGFVFDLTGYTDSECAKDESKRSLNR
eukprot:490702-Ditylum_brightwellii.AAC.2